MSDAIARGTTVSVVRWVGLGVLSVGAALAAAAGAATGPTAEEVAAVVGTWKGRLDGKPAVELALAARGGLLSGKVIFHVISNDASLVGVKHETAMTDLELKDNVLSFGFRNREGAMARMRMKLVGAYRAELRDADGSGEALGEEQALFITMEKER